MQPIDRFRNQPKHFWADIRTISQAVGYTVRGKGRINVPTIDEITSAYTKRGLSCSHLYGENGLTDFGNDVLAYFKARSELLHKFVEPSLMNADEAEKEFKRLRKTLRPMCPLPMNKQKGNKKAHAFFTGIVNMLVERYSDGIALDYDPRELTTVTRHGHPVRTMSRRVDGAFPSPVNPVAIWEIKEYYYTTTFGSRVADGVYETLLDGMELEELYDKENIDVLHYLMVDAHYTWWDCGKSYLCRIVDMLHMGYVDEVLFGREVVTRLPDLTASWVDAYKGS